MKEYIIVGNSAYSRRIKKYIDMTSFGTVCAYVVDAQYKDECLLDGIDVISFDELRQLYQPQQIDLIMGIGYNEMGDLRKRFFEQCKDWGYFFANYVHPSAIISSDVTLGEGNIILEGVIIEPNVTIGNANLIFGGSQIGHDSVIMNYTTLASRVLVSSANHIGNHCYLGDGSMVSPNTILEDYVFLGIMTCASKNMAANTVIIPEKNKIINGNKSRVYFNMFVK